MFYPDYDYDEEIPPVLTEDEQDWDDLCARCDRLFADENAIIREQAYAENDALDPAEAARMEAGFRQVLASFGLIGAA